MKTKTFFSIIIATYNSEKTIKDCLNSIKKQSFKNYELVIIDNLSSDKTIKIVRNFKFNKVKIIIEKDNGIYDALNKGIKNSSGKVISILHSDDLYYNQNVLKTVYEKYSKKISVVYGNLVYVKRNNINKFLRKWTGQLSGKNNFYNGWHPPHPAFFSKKSLYKKYGYYKTHIGNPADVELMYRFLIKYKVNSKYLDRILIKMKYGGISNNNIINIIKQNIQILKILKIDKNIFDIMIFFSKKFQNRMLQFISR